MKNECYLLLLLALSVTTATDQSQACSEVQKSLNNNQQCGAAFTMAGLILNGYDVVVDREFLNTYCSETCRSLSIGLAKCSKQVSLNSLQFIQIRMRLSCSESES